MKKLIIIMLLVCLGFMADTQEAKAQSGVVVPAQIQSKSNWCWAACSQMVHWAYKHNNLPQCYFVTISRDLENHAYAGGCNQVSNSKTSVCNQPYIFNQPQRLYPCSGSVQSILSKLKIYTVGINRAYTENEVQWHTHFKKLMVIRWGWHGGGGHFVLINQYKWGHVGYNDPLKGRRLLKYSAFKSSNGRAKWTHTLRTTSNVPFGPFYGKDEIDPTDPRAESIMKPVNSENISASVQIYPNPASTIANIQFGIERTEPVHVVIIDVLGRVQFDKEVPADMETLDLDVSSWAKGAYLIQIDNASETKQLMVK